MPRRLDGRIYVHVGDMVLVDPSRDRMGYAFYRPTASAMSQYLSKLLSVDDEFYEVGILASGR